MLYFVQFKTRNNDTYIKVGITGQIKERFYALQRGLPFKLELLHLFDVPKYQEIERKIKRFIKSDLIGEWFLLSDDNANSFEKIFELLSGYRVDDALEIIGHDNESIYSLIEEELQ